MVAPLSSIGMSVGTPEPYPASPDDGTSSPLASSPLLLLPAGTCSPPLLSTGAMSTQQWDAEQPRAPYPHSAGESAKSLRQQAPPLPHVSHMPEMLLHGSQQFPSKRTMGLPGGGDGA